MLGHDKIWLGTASLNVLQESLDIFVATLKAAEFSFVQRMIDDVLWKICWHTFHADA